jgi:hypothetical protein
MSPATEMAYGRLRVRLSASLCAHTQGMRRNPEDQKIGQNELERTSRQLVKSHKPWLL